MATLSSLLACRILRTEEPGGLQSMGWQSWTRLSDWREKEEREHSMVTILLHCMFESIVNRINVKSFHHRFPQWSTGKESTFQCSRHGFDPWSGKIPYATGQLSPCATATEVHAPRACSATRKATAVGSWRTPTGEWHPLAAAGQSPHSNKDPKQSMGNKLKTLKKFSS